LTAILTANPVQEGADELLREQRVHGALELVHQEHSPGRPLAELEDDRQKVHESGGPIRLLAHRQREASHRLAVGTGLAVVHGHQLPGAQPLGVIEREQTVFLSLIAEHKGAALDGESVPHVLNILLIIQHRPQRNVFEVDSGYTGVHGGQSAVHRTDEELIHPDTAGQGDETRTRMDNMKLGGEPLTHGADHRGRLLGGPEKIQDRPIGGEKTFHRRHGRSFVEVSVELHIRPAPLEQHLLVLGAQTGQELVPNLPPSGADLVVENPVPAASGLIAGRSDNDLHAE